MFTGIIEGMGRVIRIQDLPGSRRIWIQTPFSISKEKKGDSIAVDGCCLTVTDKIGNSFSADVSPETLSRTTLGDLKKGTPVNLERPLKLQDRLGGHLVQGHVDGVGLLQTKREIKSRGQKYLLIEFKIPRPLRKYLVEKGSIAIDGISLTLNQVRVDSFSVCLIPHTRNHTALTAKKIGDRVNLEADILAKYLEQLMKPK
jgi:riboflavin synthase